VPALVRELLHRLLQVAHAVHEDWSRPVDVIREQEQGRRWRQFERRDASTHALDREPQPATQHLGEIGKVSLDVAAGMVDEVQRFKRRPVSHSPVGPIAAVFDFPGMIQRVPGDAARGIALGPAALDQRLALGWFLELLEDGLAELADCRDVSRPWYRKADSKLFGVNAIGTDHVLQHLVSVTTTAA